MSGESTNIEILLAHDGLLRRLAVRLAGESDADDAVQETWLAALRRGTLRAATAKAWLAAVLGHAAGNTRRSRRRAMAREAAVARPDAAPSTSELVERESVRREVADALLALDPIYRDALLLRYESDLPPRKVAAALGIPVETARTRIKRGLALMRQRLDARLGPERRRSFPLLLSPVAGHAGRTAAASVAAAALVVLAVVVARRAGPESPIPSAAVSSPRAELRGTGGRPIRAPQPIRTTAFAEPVLRVLDERESDEVFPCAEPRDAAGAHRMVATRVVDELTGAAIAGALVGVIEEGPRWREPVVLRSARADRDGWVRIDVDDLRDRALATWWQADGFCAGASSGRIPPCPIRMRRASAAVRARVTDEDRAPVAGARLEAAVGAARVRVGAAATTDSNGLAELPGVDRTAASVLVRADGFLVEDVPTEGQDLLEIVLRRARPCAGIVARGGTPVAGARVTCAGSEHESCVTDSAGRFELRHAVAGGELHVSDGDRTEPVAFPAPVPGRPCTLDLDPAAEACAVSLACVAAHGEKVGGVPLALVSDAGCVKRAVSDDRGLVSVGLAPGTYDVVTDDPRAAFEAVGGTFVVDPRQTRFEVRIQVVERPGRAVDPDEDEPPAAPQEPTADRVIVAVCDGSGTSVGGAEVSIEGRRATLSATTDVRGLAAFDARALGPRARIAVRKAGLVPLHAAVDVRPDLAVAWPDAVARITVRGPTSRDGAHPVVIVDGEPMPVEGAAATAAGLAPGEHVAIVACTGWKPKVVIFEVTRAGAGSLDVTLRREP